MHLWAVHIAEGVLSPPWLIAGFLLTAVLLFVGSRRVQDEEIPRIAILASAFFVASLIHVRVGPTTVHLLLNGLVGVILGLRAVLAIAVGLVLQALLVQHGGFTALGVNCSIITLPALAVGLLFRSLCRVNWQRLPWLRSGIVGICVATWLLSVIYSVGLLFGNPPARRASVAVSTQPEVSDPVQASEPASTQPHLRKPSTGLAHALLVHPATLVTVGLVALAAVFLERRFENAPDFPLGLIIGELSVLLTVGLACLVLIEGGEENWTFPALLVVVFHLPIAMVESVIVGFAVSFLARVKPELLRATPDADGHFSTGKTSSSETSH